MAEAGRTQQSVFADVAQQVPGVLVGLGGGGLMGHAHPWLSITCIVAGVWLFLWSHTHTWWRHGVILCAALVMWGVGMYVTRDRPSRPRYSLRSPEAHAPGAKVTVADKLIEWKQEYEHYRLLVDNSTSSVVVNVSLTADLPGFVVSVGRTETTGVVELADVQVESPPWTRSALPTEQREPHVRVLELRAHRMEPDSVLSVDIVTERLLPEQKQPIGNRVGEVIVTRSHEYWGESLPDGIEEYPVQSGPVQQELIDFAHPIDATKGPDRKFSGPFMELNVQDGARVTEPPLVTLAGNAPHYRSFPPLITRSLNGR